MTGKTTNACGMAKKTTKKTLVGHFLHVSPSSTSNLIFRPPTFCFSVFIYSEHKTEEWFFTLVWEVDSCTVKICYEWYCKTETLVLIATIKPETVAWQFNLARQLVWVWTMTNCASSSPVLHCFTCTSVCRTKQSVFVLQSVSMSSEKFGNWHMFMSTSLVPMGGWSLVILLDDVIMRSAIEAHNEIWNRFTLRSPHLFRMQLTQWILPGVL